MEEWGRVAGPESIVGAPVALEGAHSGVRRENKARLPSDNVNYLCVKYCCRTAQQKRAWTAVKAGGPPVGHEECTTIPHKNTALTMNGPLHAYLSRKIIIKIGNC